MNSTALILNVDDDDSQRYVKTRDLSRAGYDVREAVTGAQGLKRVEELRPAVILLDVRLPDISGYEVCAFVKNKWPEVMVLMTSSTFTTPEHRKIGLDSGADSFLVQPTEPIELVAAVNSLLRIRKSEDDMRALNAELEIRVVQRTTELAEANAQLLAEMLQRQRAEAALVQAQKMDAIGQLTGGLAHDFNNLLTAIIGNLDLICHRPSDAKVSRWAENALKASRRGAKLTTQLLAFSRTQRLVAAPVDVNALIRGMSDLFVQTLGQHAQIELDLEKGLPLAYADVNQLELAILNLCINSRDAMPDGGRIVLKTSRDPSTHSVIASVADNGAGMPPDVLSRAFDPFFTTKAPGRGTGLGLSQVFGIVTQLGGDVSIESAQGVGTTVTLKLRPAAGGALRVEAAAGQAAEVGHERVLVVDDDADVLNVISEVLSGAGYHVAQASNGDVAAASFDNFKPHLVIVDFAMPEENGADLAERLRAKVKDVPILFVSGFPDEQRLRQAVAGAPILRKPFSPTELSAAVREAIAATR